ncbi:DUF3047 domain-containing protein [candidate division KSB3 bacterium]|uniref:DUF3047 domain-containing protein n=1 Tax=candidate division KSB3 bacterium TaxID=2044937 RepID=A0A9D5JUV6_9BACT|nr:DUF3047 domain-containing protein [candidate division KSB3 bacterium]MBD3324544.1 DUF3047 domain-containing protein [candidate division KSB3 bacterium]
MQRLRQCALVGIGIGYFVLILVNSLACAAENVLLHEDFQTLERWEPFYFPKIEEHSTYTIEAPDVLKAESNASASAIKLKERFNVYEYPHLEWRWKVENVYAKGDAKKKDGDDYPLRIYIVFKYDPDKAGFGKKLKYKTAKALYGEYPPHSSLNYIWANKAHPEDILTNTYADEAKMILLQKGTKHVGTWQVERVHILDDYQKAFDEEPPEIASIVIMSDADNTKEQATAYIDYIKIFQTSP